jgi:hypothetical protein
MKFSNVLHLLVIVLLVSINKHVIFAQDPDETIKKSRTEKQWDRHRINASVIDKSNQVFDGQILYVNDSVLYHFVSKDEYTPDDFLTSVVRFKLDDIQAVQVARKGKGLQGLLIGTTIGATATMAITVADGGGMAEIYLLVGSIFLVAPAGGIGTLIGLTFRIKKYFDFNDEYYGKGEIMERLSKYAIYSAEQPKELLLYSDNENRQIQLEKDEVPLKNKENAGRNWDPLSYNNHKSPYYIPRFHFHSGLFHSKSTIPSDLDNYNSGNSFKRFIDYTSALHFNIGASYRIKKHYRLNIDHSKVTYNNLSSKNFGNTGTSLSVDNYIVRRSLQLSLDYVFNPIDHRLNSRLECYVGAGASLNSFILINELYYYEPYEVLQSYQPYIYDAHYLSKSSHISSFGLNARLGADFYLNSVLSVFCVLSGTFSKGFSIPEMEVSNNGLTETYKLSEYEIRPRYLDINFGLHVHF